MSDLHVRQPRAWDFVRLKLRIMRNGLRGRPRRVVLFVLGAIGGLWAAVLGFAAFAAAGFAGPSTRDVYVAYLGTGLVLAWVLLPLLFFGVDETLDPSRFALLPVRPKLLATGMLAAACVGIPPAATLGASLGSVVGAATHGGAGAAVVAVLGALVGLALCVAASRAVTSAFATLLRSRRARDATALLIALLAVSCSPLQGVLIGGFAAGHTSRGQLAAHILGWTPLAAPYVAYADAVAGHWALVPLRFAVGLAGIAALLWWWSRTLESAMLGVASGSGPRGLAKGTPVDALYPRLLRGLPKTRFWALVVREVRYWWRHPRRRAGLIALLAASVFLPFGLRISAGQPDQAIPLPIAMVFGGVFVGLVLANQFGNDGSAYGLHLLTGVPGKAEIGSRVLGLGLFTVPFLLLGGVAVGLLTGAADQLPAAIGSTFAAFGVGSGVASVVSVLVPYELPDSPNPFASGTGRSGAKGLLSFVGMIVSWVLVGPVIVAYELLPSGVRWSLLFLGVAWGVLFGWLGALAGGALLDRRTPEVLMAVTPRR